VASVYTIRYYSRGIKNVGEILQYAPTDIKLFNVRGNGSISIGE